VVYAFHEFTEGAAIPGIDNAYWHAATEDLAEGTIAQAISLALVLVPTVWLGLAHWRERRTAPSSAAATAMDTQAAAPRAAQ
ncbi:MAG: iron permease, partial [Betaproteobacteria bacterium]